MSRKVSLGVLEDSELRVGLRGLVLGSRLELWLLGGCLEVKTNRGRSHDFNIWV